MFAGRPSGWALAHILVLSTNLALYKFLFVLYLSCMVIVQVQLVFQGGGESRGHADALDKNCWHFPCLLYNQCNMSCVTVLLAAAAAACLLAFVACLPVLSNS